MLTRYQIKITALLTVITFILPIIIVTSVSAKKKNLEGIVNINISSIKTLSTLPGINKKRARAIVEYRENNGDFDKIEDITKVKGIGKKTLKKIQDYIAVEGDTTINISKK